MQAKKKLLLLTLAQDQLNTRRVAAILVAYGGLSFSDGMSQNRTSGRGFRVGVMFLLKKLQSPNLCKSKANTTHPTLVRD